MNLRCVGPLRVEFLQRELRHTTTGMLLPCLALTGDRGFRIRALHCGFGVDLAVPGFDFRTLSGKELRV